MNDSLSQKIKKTPRKPGCYLFKDDHGSIIYVGKSKRLDRRVKQYFQESSQADERVERLVRHIADVESITTESEIDALLLEYRLIKQHKPWFNSQMKPDEVHPYIRIGIREEYPSLCSVIEMDDDGALYYSYYDKYAAMNAIEAFNMVWKTPMCGKVFEKPSRACVEYETGNCSGPCARKISADAYRADIESLVDVLNGNRTPREDQMDADMRAYANAKEYENAFRCKTALTTIALHRGRGRKMFNLPTRGDMVVFLRQYRGKAFSLFYIRDRKMLSRMDFGGELDDGGIDVFLNMAEADKCAVRSETWLPQCLAEVVADKLFVIMPEATEIADRVELIREGYRDFFGV